MKRQAWGIIPLALIVLGLIVLFGRDSGSPPAPHVLEESARGMTVLLPTITDEDSSPAWKAQWVSADKAARQQVAQSLTAVRADYKQLRPRLRVSVDPDSQRANRLAQRIGEALAHHDLGLYASEPFEPSSPALSAGAVLYCSEPDRAMALRLLGALAPYLGGRVEVRFSASSGPQTMRLHLQGDPWFNRVGQANFAPDLGVPAD